jgi:hypothetical protein
MQKLATCDILNETNTFNDAILSGIPSDGAHGQRAETRNRDLGRKKREEIFPVDIILFHVHLAKESRYF